MTNSETETPGEAWPSVVKTNTPERSLEFAQAAIVMLPKRAEVSIAFRINDRTSTIRLETHLWNEIRNNLAALG